MISHANILAVLACQDQLGVFYQDDIALSFLPMAHVAERVLAFYGRINTGMPTAFASSTSAVLDELREVQPTVFGSVPRIFEKGYSRIRTELERASPGKRRIFAWAERVGLARLDRVLAGRPVPMALRLKHRVADRLVFARVRAAFGGRVRLFITGAAPTPMDVLRFFWAAGLPIYEVYGQTEATVVTHANTQGAVRLGTVGRALPPVEHRIADDGEVLVRGPLVFQGYFKDAEATAAAIQYGWLHTGDIGTIDAEGYLRITDRKKHIIITAGGKNLTPANIENEIKTQDPIISHVHAHGDRRPFVTAIVTVSPLEAIEWARERGLLEDQEAAERMKRELMENPLARPEGLDDVIGAVTSHADMKKRIAEAVRRGNDKLSRVEQVKRVYVLPRELSADEDEITPTLKVKRKNVEKKFASQLDKLYEDASFGIVVMDK